MIQRLTALALAALCASSALANDSSASLGAGGLVLTRSADIRMAEELLSISPKLISIRYNFVNDSPRDIETIVAFPLPDIDAGTFTMSPLGTVLENAENFVGFKVAADGKPVAVNVEQRAFYQGRDVTDAVRAAGLPVNVVNQAGFRLLEKLTPAQKKILSDAGIAEWESSEAAHPLWTVRTRFWWKQRFPARKPLVLDQSYQPITGQSFFAASDLSTTTEEGRRYLQSYCIDPAMRSRTAAAVAASQKADPQGGGYYLAFATDYILMTANNWKGPIGHFRLVLDKLKPNNLLSLCWDGPLKKTGPTTFAAERRNFAPKRDIRLLVLEPPAAK